MILRYNIPDMSRRRKLIWLAAILLALAGSAGGFWWYWQSTAIDRKVKSLIYELAGYPDTKFEKQLRSWKLDFLIKEKPEPREFDAVYKDLEAIGSNATPGLIALLDDEDEDVQLRAFAFMCELGDNRIVEPLIQILQHSQELAFRQMAAGRLGELGDKRAVEPLIQTLLQTNDDCVDFMCAVSLGKLGDKRAVEPLIISLQNGRGKQIIIHSALALQTLGDPRAIETLEDILQTESDPDVRKYCQAALDELKSASTQPAGG